MPDDDRLFHPELTAEPDQVVGEPGLAGDEQHLSTAVADLLETTPERLELRRAADEHRTDDRRTSRRCHGRSTVLSSVCPAPTSSARRRAHSTEPRYDPGNVFRRNQNVGFRVYNQRGQVVATGGAQPGVAPNVSGDLTSGEKGRYLVQVFNYDPSVAIDYELSLRR